MATRLSPVRAVCGALLAIAGCYLAYRSWDDAHFAYLRQANPAKAIASRSNDGHAVSKSIDLRMNREPSSPPRPAETELASRALADAPLSRGLLRIVALGAEAGGDMARADKAMGLASAVSRRDALTQLWLIERSVRRDDMKDAVRHYHAAMSVHPELRTALFSVLAKAVAFPEVRKALAPYIVQRTPWSNGFLNAAIVEGDPANVAQLITSLGTTARAESYRGLNARLLSQLAAKGDFAMAGKLAGTVVPGFRPAVLQSLAVNEATTDKRLGMLAWTFAEDGRALASVNEEGGFDIDVEPLSRTAVATRMMPLSGGRSYRLVHTLRGSGASDPVATLSWQGNCLTPQGKALIWQQMLPKPRETQSHTWTIAVPQACKGLELVLIATGPEGQQAAHAVVGALDLKPNVD